MQQERTAFQLVQLSSTAGVPYPPVLLKLSTSTSSSSYEHSHSASQLPASQTSSTVNLICSATRFVNGRQQLVEFELGQEKVLEAGRTGLQSSRMTIDEVMDEVLSRLRKREYAAEYKHERSEVKVTLNDVPGLPLKFDFSSAESVRATPAFVLAFEAASAFAEIVTTSEKSALEAADALKARERDLRISERKLQNTQQELSDKNNQYTRLLATGGLGAENGGSPGKSVGRRAPSVVPMDMDDGSPRKKRKAAAPTLTGAGRIVRKKVKTGFIDSDDENSGSSADGDDEPPKQSKAVGGSATTFTSRQAGRAASTPKEEDDEDDHEQNNKDKHKALKAALSIAKSGRTAQKQVEKGFVDDDSATDED